MPHEISEITRIELYIGQKSEKDRLDLMVLSVLGALVIHRQLFDKEMHKPGIDRDGMVVTFDGGIDGLSLVRPDSTTYKLESWIWARAMQGLKYSEQGNPELF